MHVSPHDIFGRVRRGEINLELLVATLRGRGFITELNQEPGCGFAASAMEALDQEDFERLFEFFFPDEICDIEIRCASTDEGGRSGAYAYALFNANVVSRDVMLQLLKKQNQKSPR
jgi:hypothetical protein